jgi:EAL domain-containing protein (putative c-di-GMP-specific phosphodiesterase class I)
MSSALVLGSDKAELASALRRAVAQHELAALYLPVIALATGRAVSFEALIRWNRPGVRLLTPDAFLGIAEQTGVIHELGGWMINRAISDCAQWQTHAPQIGVSVNLSRRQLQNANLVDTIAETLYEFRVSPELFEIEVAEQALNDELAIDLLRQARELGIKVVLDDFGSGETRLKTLDRAVLDELKIDAPIVATLEDPRDDPRFIAAIMHAARAYGLNVIAEGVDSTTKLRRLRDLGCQFGQGLLFGEPQPAGRVLRDLAQTNLAHEAPNSDGA